MPQSPEYHLDLCRVGTRVGPGVHQVPARRDGQAAGNCRSLAPIRLACSRSQIGVRVRTMPRNWPQGSTNALNEDGSLNGPDHPALIGSAITFFLTGLGRLTGPLVNDAITPASSPLPGLAVPFQFWIEGTTASGADGLGILYAGPAPGMPPGVYAIKAQVPDRAKPGNVGVRLMPSKLLHGSNSFVFQPLIRLDSSPLTRRR